MKDDVVDRMSDEEVDEEDDLSEGETTKQSMLKKDNRNYK